MAKRSYTQDTTWPESLPSSQDKYFVSIGCGNTKIHFALHNNRSKYDTESNLYPKMTWKTPHIIEQDLIYDKADVFARLLPRILQEYYFGESSEFNEKTAKEVAKGRGHNITYYIASSNEKQTEYITLMLSCVNARVFRMKGDDFFSTLDGRYDTMGIDRCACLKGSATLYGTPSLVIDGGTAITYTALDKHGKIIGGGITPGISMRLNSMNEGTEGLPLITYDELLKEYAEKALHEQRPLQTFSRDTKEAMSVTILTEIAVNMRHVINLWLQKTGLDKSQAGDFKNSKTPIVITGGSGEILTKLLEPEFGGLIESPHIDNQNYSIKWEPSILHTGIAAVLLYNVKRNYNTEKESKEDEVIEINTARKEDYEQYVGSRVAKYFKQRQTDGDRIYRGDVVSHEFRGGIPIYFVSYDDGDKEEMTLEKVQDAIDLFSLHGEKTSEKDNNKRQKNNPLSYPYEGFKVAKVFENGVFSGEVIGYDGTYWMVLYEDNDREEYDEDDIKAGIALYRSNEKVAKK